MFLIELVYEFSKYISEMEGWESIVCEDGLNIQITDKGFVISDGNGFKLKIREYQDTMLQSIQINHQWTTSRMVSQHYQTPVRELYYQVLEWLTNPNN